MFIRTLVITLVFGVAPAASLAELAPAESVGWHVMSLSDPASSSVELDIPPGVELPHFPSALETDVMGNPVYTPETKDVLIDQIATGFSEFDQIGLDPSFDSGTPTARPPAKAPFALTSIVVYDPLARQNATKFCGTSAECELPLNYNVGPAVVRLVWGFRDSTVRDQFLDYINQTNGRGLRVLLNGKRLARNPLLGPFVPWNTNSDYSATYSASSGCPLIMPKGCLILSVRRNAWFRGPAPWPKWEIVVEGLLATGPRDYEVEVSASRVVTPKPIVKDFFTATIAKSTMSARCTTCHEIDTPIKIEERHGDIGVSAESVTLADSIVNAGEMINTCVNCHEADLPEDFNERRWATPTPPQDINWGSIINADPNRWPLEICERIVGNLETPFAREEHFHEDARLFWAVADGNPPFGPPLPTSHPKDYDAFLDHFDAWNDAGAPCPVPEPSGYGALFAGGGWLLLLIRRRTRAAACTTEFSLKDGFGASSR